MSTIEIIAGCTLILCSIIIVIAVSMQSNKGSGLTTAIMGGSDNSYRGKGKSTDAKLATLTKWLAGILFIVTIAVNIIALVFNNAGGAGA